METEGLKISFGRHEGSLFTRVPVRYLLRMVQNNIREHDIAQAEIDRRGTIIPTMDISGHAIDSASKRLLGVWTGTKQEGEGLHSWLHRVARDAFDSGELDEEGRIIYMGIKFIFESTGNWPTLKTVMPR